MPRDADTAVARKSVPVTMREAAALDLIRAPGLYRDALAQLSHEALGDNPSEAKILHVLITLALSAVREEVESAGYAEMAAQQDKGERKAIARRRRPAWADE